MSKSNPTLLDLLKAGAKVEFDNETWLHGDPKDAYIRVGYMGLEQGVWFLDKDGLVEALEDIEKIYAEKMGDDFTDLTGSQGYVGGIGIIQKNVILKDIENYSMQSRGRLPNTSGVVVDRLREYSIVNEDNVILEGSNTRVEVRRRFEIRLDQAMAV